MKLPDGELLRFLWPYFRRYWGVLVLAMGTTLIFATSTVMLLALFRPILAEVLLADAGTSGGALGALVASAEEEPEAAEEDEEPGMLERLGLDIDFDMEAFFEQTVEAAKALFEIEGDEVVWFLPTFFFLVFVLRSLSIFGNGYLFQVVGLGATNDLRNDLYERILHQSSRFYAEHPSGELVSRVSNDISVMQNAVSSRLLDLFMQSVTLIFLIWYLLSAHFKLALICLVAVPAVIYPIVRFGKGMRRTSHRSQERLADLSNLVAEAVRGHRVVKAFGMEAFELGRFRLATARHLKVKLRAQLLTYASGPVVEAMAALGSAAFLIYAGRAVREGTLDPSELLQFITNLVMLYDPIRKLNKVNLVLQEATAAAQRVHGIMELENHITERPDAAKLPTLDKAIHFDNVAFAYDQAPVLQGIDLTIRRGEMVALVGSSGAGKSTLVNLLPRFFDPDQGAVRIDGVDLREGTLASLRGQIGIVTQDTMLFNDSIRDNIAYGRTDLSQESVEAAAQAAYAHEFILAQNEGYDTVIGESGLKLSGGQRQRLAIARALVKDPPILILDEATSHLDSEAEALVQKALGRLMVGRTALVIAHRLSTVQRADRIVVLDQGQVVEEGSHTELLASGGAYKRLYDLQFRET